MIEGFDSRYWNGKMVNPARFRFYIAKATESDYFANCLCPNQIESAIRLGIDTGCYHFYRRYSDPSNAAALYKHYVRPFTQAMRFPILDCEDGSCPPGKRSATHLWESVQAIEQAFGRECMIYTARWWWNQHVWFELDHPIYTRPLWEADPPPDTPEPGGFGKPVITQYRLDLKTSGINASIDLNRADEAWYNANVNLLPF